MMSFNVEAFKPAISVASTHAELQAIAESICNETGLQHLMFNSANMSGSPLFFGTYGMRWITRYLEMQYYRNDPVVQACYRSFDPVNWNQLDWSPRPAARLRNDSLEHGVGSQGLSFPIRGPFAQFAILTISHTCEDDEWNAYIEENTCSFLRLGIQLNRAVLRLHTGAIPEISRHLSPREIEVMTLLARGQSRSKAAQELQISEHTLRVHIEAARKKMDASNTINAVARSIMMGYVIL